jgi:hypothetical protein
MPIIAKYEKPEYSNAPEGLFNAICCDVVDLGLKTTAFGDKHKIRIVWQLEERDPDKGWRYNVSQQYTLSLHPKSVLSQALEAWRGKKFTDDEREGFDLEKLIGVGCQVQVVHQAGQNGNVYANVQAIVPLGKGMTKVTPEGYVRVKDRAAQPRVETVESALADVPF